MKRQTENFRGVKNVDSSASPGDTYDFTGFDPYISAFVNHTSRNPGGSTSIGAGVTHFEPELNLGGDDYHQTVLLFTDGEQNRAPYLVPNLASDPPKLHVNPASNAPGDPGAYEFAPNISICPFALLADNPSAAALNNYLQAISDLRCDGLMNTAISMDPGDPDLEKFFLRVLHDALIGDKLELLKVTSGQITHGPGTKIPGGQPDPVAIQAGAAGINGLQHGNWCFCAPGLR